MDLRSGETVWQVKDAPLPVYPPLGGDERCDVAIIGAGITGGLIAYELTKAGLQCILLDKNEAGAGSTLASTALLSYELDLPLFELAKRIGEADAAASYQACYDAIGKIQRIIAELGGPGEFRLRKSFYFAESEEDVPDLETECALRNKHRLPVDLLRPEEIGQLFSFTRPAALLTNCAGEINVVQLLEALLRAAAARGLRIYGRTKMAAFDCTATGAHLQTEAGRAITARALVFATGYESEKYLGRRVGHLKSTFAIATAPLRHFRGWHERSLIWTSARPYLYLRTTADDRAVIGGEDIDFQDPQLRDALLPAKTASLEAKLRTMFPDMDFTLACAWAGTFEETEDSMAYIGQPPGNAGQLFCARLRRQWHHLQRDRRRDHSGCLPGQKESRGAPVPFRALTSSANACCRFGPRAIRGAGPWSRAAAPRLTPVAEWVREGHGLHGPHGSAKDARP